MKMEINLGSKYPHISGEEFTEIFLLGYNYATTNSIPIGLLKELQEKARANLQTEENVVEAGVYEMFVKSIDYIMEIWEKTL